TIPGRSDFGATSLDCPPANGDLIATMPRDLSNATAPVTKAVAIDGPFCTADTARCLCDTCNNASAQPCMHNSDCPGGTGICGGRRCLSGTNNGSPCGNNSVCPGGVCGRPG